MGKIISAYGGLTATAIKAKADIPAQANMIISGDNIDCTNIAISQVKSVLGIGDNNLVTIYSHATVNKWSEFGPYAHNNSSGVLSNSIKYPYILGDFAGYNHNAVKPNINNYTTAISYQDGTKTVSISTNIEYGEINYMNSAINTNYVIIEVLDRFNNVVGSNIQPMGTTYLTTDITFTDNASVNFTAYVYLCDYFGSQRCAFPDVSSFTIYGSWSSNYVNYTANCTYPLSVFSVGGDIYGNYDFNVDNMSGAINVDYTIFDQYGTPVNSGNAVSNYWFADISGTLPYPVYGGYSVVFTVYPV